jgi:hypothetical protein
MRLHTINQLSRMSVSALKVPVGNEAAILRFVATILNYVAAILCFRGGYTRSDPLSCHSQLMLRFSWAVTTITSCMTL